MRWSHQGVELRSPIRRAGALRAAAASLLIGFGLLNAVGFALVSPPPADRGLAACAAREARGDATCEPLRPSWQRWDYPELGAYAQARACSVSQDAGAVERLIAVRPALGVQSMANLRFLGRVGTLAGRCEVPTASAALIEREYQALVALEDQIWAERAASASARDRRWRDRRAAWHASARRLLPLWLPALLLTWLALWVGARRLLRAARPLRLAVGTAGVQLDAVWVPRASIAYLSLEGQRLRVERWSGPPLYSRPLPPAALADVDEVCASAGWWEDDADRSAAGAGIAPAALERLVRAHRAPPIGGT